MSDKIQELVEQIKNESESGEHEKTREVLHVYLSELVKSFKQFELELPQALIEIAKAIKVELPDEQKVRVMNPKDIRTTLTPAQQSTVKLEPGSLTELSLTLKAIKDGMDSLKSQETKLPTKAKDAIAVRLSDGEKFIEQLTQVITQGAVGGGGGSVPKITVAGTQVVPVTNPDGTIIGSGTPSNIDSYVHAAINLSAGADQVLVASSPNKQVWVYAIHFSLSANGTVSFQDEDNTAITGVMNFAQYSGISTALSGNFSMPIWKLATNKDLEVDLVTADMDGWIDYAIVSV
jgi:hypothetical protein